MKAVACGDGEPGVTAEIDLHSNTGRKCCSATKTHAVHIIRRGVEAIAAFQKIEGNLGAFVRKITSYAQNHWYKRLNSVQVCTDPQTGVNPLVELVTFGGLKRKRGSGNAI